MSKIYFASDHAGFGLKAVLLQFAPTLGYEVEDVGPYEIVATDDYPEYITPLARAVAGDATARGVIIGKSGQGEAMCANRIKGARAAVFYGGSLGIIRLAREHNDANILSLGAGFVNEEEAKSALKLFLDTAFSCEERHIRRLAKF